MILLAIALFGLVVPNGLFLYWLLYEYDGVMNVAHNKLALAFILDAFLAMGLLAYYFARLEIRWVGSSGIGSSRSRSWEGWASAFRYTGG